MESKIKGDRRPNRILSAIIAAFLVAFFIKIFIFDFMITEGRSMVPTLLPGQVVMVNHLAYGFRLPWTNRYVFRWSAPQRGDIVIFPSPLGEIAVKRVGALVGNSQFIALGDNQAESFDSRTYGPIPLDAILGKVLWVK